MHLAVPKLPDESLHAAGSSSLCVSFASRGPLVQRKSLRLTAFAAAKSLHKIAMQMAQAIALQ